MKEAYLFMSTPTHFKWGPITWRFLYLHHIRASNDDRAESNAPVAVNPPGIRVTIRVWGRDDVEVLYEAMIQALVV
jgi:hypothetical protein